VVNIHGRKTVRPDDEQFATANASRQVNGMGTGVVIDPRGYIVTNYHVVDGVGRIQVTTAVGKTLIAKLVAHDPRTDLAIIKVDASEPLPVIPIGTSCDLMPGEDVVAIGNAYGYEHTVTKGIISALHRPVQVNEDQKYTDLIQTDASINPGNSGGPLLNIEGDMIGLNVAVRVGAQGIGFAVPVDETIEVAARLLDLEVTRKVSHGLSGKSVVRPGSSEFVVTSVAAAGPADNGGLEPGDVITAVEGQPIARALDFPRALLDRRPGEEIELTLRRNNEPRQMRLVLGEQFRQQRSTSALAWELLGLRLSQVPAQSFRHSRYRGGLKVLAVRPEGPAAQQGIRHGDVLVGMHKWETASLDNVAYILGSQEFRNSQAVKFYVLRGSETLYGHLRVVEQ
jgi:serine protease Do